MKIQNMSKYHELNLTVGQLWKAKKAEQKHARSGSKSQYYKRKEAA
jgi:hypothetical protein